MYRQHPLWSDNSIQIPLPYKVQHPIRPDEALARERRIQNATLAIKKKYGKNALFKGMNLEEGATAKDRNAQIGGHKA